MRFRSISYPKMLLETLRAYYSVNVSGQVNELYKYCACLIQPLIVPFNAYEQERIINGLIANTKWQIGQLTNVLNYLYDNVNNSIYISQSSQNIVSAVGFAYPAISQMGGFGGLAVQTRGFDDKAAQTPVIIHVPNTVNLSALTATVAQVALAGIYYEIVEFTP